MNETECRIETRWDLSGSPNVCIAEAFDVDGNIVDSFSARVSADSIDLPDYLRSMSHRPEKEIEEFARCELRAKLARRPQCSPPRAGK